MVKKLLWGVIVVAVIGFIVWSKNPLDDTVNFIIGGSVPNSDLSIGFWSMAGIILLILLVILKAISNLKLQMLAATAKQIKSEEAKKEFEDSNNFEFDRSQRSVIAARN